MITQYGAPLAGAQMKLLRAAGLPDETEYQFQGMWSGQWQDGGRAVQSEFLGKNYRLPADHPAYALLEKGWLDGRNVALWFGGEKAPDDWDGGSCLLRNGDDEGYAYKDCLSWRDDGAEYDIIAYTRKAEAPRMEVTEDVNDTSKIPPVRHIAPQPETVTIAKMTPTEIKARYPKGVQPLVVMQTLGLIKPEPTREDRFWQAQPNGGAHVGVNAKAWVREALEFER